MTDQEIYGETPEEVQAEDDVLKTSEEELREKVAERFGLEDNEDNKDMLDKLVGDRKGFNKVVKQKRGYRSDLEEAQKGETPPTPPEPTPPAPQGADKPITQADLDERDRNRDLDDMGVSDETKESIKNLSQIKGISVKEAAKDPYVVHLKEQDETKAREANASAGGTNAPTGKDSENETPNFDMSTKEGRKEREEWNKNEGRKSAGSMFSE